MAPAWKTLKDVADEGLALFPDDLHRNVFRKRFGLDGEGVRSVQATAEVLGVTEEVVEEAEQNGLQILRAEGWGERVFELLNSPLSPKDQEFWNKIFGEEQR